MSTSTGRGTSGNLFEGLFSGTVGTGFAFPLNPVRFADGTVPPTAPEIRQAVFLAAQ